MTKIFRGLVAAFLFGFALNAAAELSDLPSGAYALDKSHGYITFSYSHLGFSNPHIGFDRFDVDLTLDSENPANSKLDVVIDATSINSRVEAFNGHLNGPNFFDTANNPSITFSSTRIEATGDDTYDVIGDLTIIGTTLPVTLDATINQAANHPMKKIPTIGASGSAKVMRSDFGFMRALPNVGDEITIYISVELPQKK